MSASNAKIIDRYRKLMAKANDPSVTEEEAASYAAGAADLLARHGLEMADVPEAERDDHMTQETYDHKYAGDAWLKAIALQAARLYFCEMILTQTHTQTTARRRSWSPYDGRYVEPGEMRTEYKTAYIFVGRPHNIAVCREMVSYLFETTKRLSRTYSPARAEYLAFQRGCGERLASRLYKMWWDNQPKKSQPVASSQGLPALYASEADLVKNFISENIETKKSGSRGSSLDGEHAAAGARAGDAVSLDPQVGGGSRGAMLLS